MRKRITNQDPQRVSAADQSWLDLPHVAEVELTSEDPVYPIEACPHTRHGIGLAGGTVWRAVDPPAV
jgi:hypothetical protein